MSKKFFTGILIISLCVIFAGCGTLGVAPNAGHWTGSEISFDVSLDGKTINNLYAKISWSSTEGSGFASINHNTLPINGGVFSIPAFLNSFGIKGTFISTTSCSGTMSSDGHKRNWTATLAQ